MNKESTLISGVNDAELLQTDCFPTKAVGPQEPREREKKRCGDKLCYCTPSKRFPSSLFCLFIINKTSSNMTLPHLFQTQSKSSSRASSSGWTCFWGAVPLAPTPSYSSSNKWWLPWRIPPQPKSVLNMTPSFLVIYRTYTLRRARACFCRCSCPEPVMSFILSSYRLFTLASSLLISFCS